MNFTDLNEIANRMVAKGKEYLQQMKVHLLVKKGLIPLMLRVLKSIEIYIVICFLQLQVWKNL